MRIKFKFKKLALAVGLCSLSVVHSSAPERMGSYDFSYESTGDAKVKPVQVFDDGANTYFQFRAGEPVPAIFVNGLTGPVMQMPELQGPYVKITSVGGGYILRMGRGTATVTYGGDRSTIVAAVAAPVANTGAFAQLVQPGAPVMTTMAASAARMQAAAMGRLTVASAPRNVFDDQPPPRIALDVNSYATPIKGDLAQFQPTGHSPVVGMGTGTQNGFGKSVTEGKVPFVIGISKLGPKGTAQVRGMTRNYVFGDKVEVIGRYDASYKEGLAQQRAKSVVEALVTGGVPREVISFKTTEVAVPNEPGGIAMGASVSIGTPASAPATQAFVTTEQAQEAGLTALASRLASKNITSAQAARQVDAIRAATAGHFVQPTAGWQEAQISKWQMRAIDGTVQGVLQRWANDAGWQLIWKNGPEIKVNGDAELVRDGFVSAADYLLSQSRSFGHRIKGRSYNNKVLVVTSE